MFRTIALLLTMLVALAAGVALAPSVAQARYASIVVDVDSGQVLHAVNADTPNYPASLTKMMTLYLLFEALEKGEVTLDQALPVSKRASGMAPSKLGLRPGERSEEHTSELQSLMRISYAVFCLKKKTKHKNLHRT